MGNKNSLPPDIPIFTGPRIDFELHWRTTPHRSLPQTLFGEWDIVDYDENDSLEKIYLDIKPTGWIYYYLLKQSQLCNSTSLTPTIIECVMKKLFLLLPNKFYYGFFTDHMAQQWDDPGALNQQEFHLVFGKGECAIRETNGRIAFYCEDSIKLKIEQRGEQRQINLRNSRDNVPTLGEVELDRNFLSEGHYDPPWFDRKWEEILNSPKMKRAEIGVPIFPCGFHESNRRFVNTIVDKMIAEIWSRSNEIQQQLSPRGARSFSQSNIYIAGQGKKRETF